MPDIPTGDWYPSKRHSPMAAEASMPPPSITTQATGHQAIPIRPQAAPARSAMARKLVGNVTAPDVAL